MAERRLPHLKVEGRSSTHPCRGRSGGGSRRPSDVPDRGAHAQRVLTQIEGIREYDEASATYMEIVGRPGEPFDAQKFDVSGLQLLRLDEGDVERNFATRATVMASKEGKGILKLKNMVRAFEHEDTKPRNGGESRPRNADLVQSIDMVREPDISRLWRNKLVAFPSGSGVLRWEIWLIPSQAESFVSLASQYGITVYGDRLEFPEDTVVLAEGTVDSLEGAVKGIGSVRGLAAPAAPLLFTESIPLEEQREWVNEALDRISFSRPSRGKWSFATVLDTGISRANRLIRPALAKGDRHVAVSGWSRGDRNGHGTRMAGLVTYGDLRLVLEGTTKHPVRHRLESVKVIADRPGPNQNDLFGTTTIDAVNVAEQAASRLRTFVLASTTSKDSPHKGTPTSWSSTLDQLAAGAVEPKHGRRRLIVVSAGNVKQAEEAKVDYLKVCDDPEESEVESPAQAWNAITIGAMTEKVGEVGGETEGRVLAKAGDLSPSSRTASWESKWPIKPDLVLEGGNWYDAGVGPPMEHPELMLVSTYYQPRSRIFTDMSDTSAATALAGRDLAILRDMYPELWPETVRALYVGSGEWNEQMWSHLKPKERKSKRALGVLFRRYGYGVPNLPRALRSASNSVTLIVEDTLRPYRKEGSVRKIHEMRLIDLPWPRQALRDLGVQEVTLRVALSYFIEPNPGKVPVQNRERYPSHLLRFDLKDADETVAQFRRRVSRISNDEDGNDVGARTNQALDSSEWMFGPRRRNAGTLHIDRIRLSALDLSRRGKLAVFPVGGWWKYHKSPDLDDREVRYSLVVEIDAEGIDVDLYSEIRQVIAATTKTATTS